MIQVTRRNIKLFLIYTLKLQGMEHVTHLEKFPLARQGLKAPILSRVISLPGTATSSLREELALWPRAPWGYSCSPGQWPLLGREAFWRQTATACSLYSQDHKQTEKQTQFKNNEQSRRQLFACGHTLSHDLDQLKAQAIGDTVPSWENS